MRKYIFVLTVILPVLAVACFVNAQEKEFIYKSDTGQEFNLESIDLEEAIKDSLGGQEREIFVIATVNVQRAEILSQEENSFRIGFDIANEVGVQPGVRYGIHVFGLEGGLFDEEIYDEVISLGENDSVHREVDYTAPDSLNGEFNIFITAENTANLLLGQMPAGKVTLNGTGENELIPYDRYLLKDYSSKIQNLFLDKDYYSKGDAAKLSVAWFTQEPEKVNLEASIKDSLGRTCSDAVNKEILKQDYVPLIEIEVPVTRECLNPQIKVALIDSGGNVLDEADFEVISAAREEELSSNEKLFSYLFILILIIVIGAVVLIFGKNKNE